MQHRKVIGSFVTLSLLGLLAGCAKDEVDLGGSSSVQQGLEVGARCVDSPIVEGAVFVANQDELEALRGCEAIRGNLLVLVFEGTDLSPLASLREVGGDLILGISAHEVPFEDFPNPEAQEAALAEAEQSAQIVEAGWLGSLQGLEGLELVGTLSLLGIAAPDLSAFENLRNVGAHPEPDLGGRIEIRGARNLVDLRGLEGVAGIDRLLLVDNPSLTSLEGVQLNRQIQTIVLQSVPNLTDLTALSSVELLTGLVILAETGVQNLDALASVTSVVGISLLANPELTDVNGLANLFAVESLLVMSNPKLASLPQFGALQNGLEEFIVVDNVSLRSASLDFQSITTTRPLDVQRRLTGERPRADEPRRTIENGSTWFQFSDNPQLESVSVGGRLTSALVLEVNGNERLSSIDLGTLRSLNALSITANPALSQVALGDIQTVNTLAVIDNPNLVTAELLTVRTFETVTRGNADDPAE